MAALGLERHITTRHPRFSDLTQFLKIHAKQRAQKYTTARSSLLVLSYKAVPVVLRDGPLALLQPHLLTGLFFLKPAKMVLTLFLYIEL